MDKRAFGKPRRWDHYRRLFSCEEIHCNGNMVIWLGCYSFVDITDDMSAS